MTSTNEENREWVPDFSEGESRGVDLRSALVALSPDHARHLDDDYFDVGADVDEIDFVYSSKEGSNTATIYVNGNSVLKVVDGGRATFLQLESRADQLVAAMGEVGCVWRSDVGRDTHMGVVGVIRDEEENVQIVSPEKIGSNDVEVAILMRNLGDNSMLSKLVPESFDEKGWESASKRLMSDLPSMRASHRGMAKVVVESRRELSPEREEEVSGGDFFLDAIDMGVCSVLYEYSDEKVSGAAKIFRTLASEFVESSDDPFPSKLDRVGSGLGDPALNNVYGWNGETAVIDPPAGLISSETGERVTWCTTRLTFDMADYTNELLGLARLANNAGRKDVAEIYYGLRDDVRKAYEETIGREFTNEEVLSWAVYEAYWANTRGGIYLLNQPDLEPLGKMLVEEVALERMETALNVAKADRL